MKAITEREAKNLRDKGQGHRVVRTQNHWYLIEDLYHRDSSCKPKPRFYDKEDY